MAYLLENQTEAHSNALLETLQTWSELESDVHLISNEGAVLQTHRVYLKLYSKVLSSALGDFSSVMIPSIFIPASTASLVNLIKILSTGVSISERKEDLLDVIHTAEMLGMNLKDIQIGAKRNPDSVEEEVKVDKEIKEKKKIAKPKKKKTTKSKPEEIVSVKKEYVEVDSDISFSVNEQSDDLTFQQEFINQGVSVKDEQAPDSDVSLSLQLDSSTDGDNSPSSTKNQDLKGGAWPSLSREPHTCKECGKTFVNKEKMKRHGVIHTGEKPFACNECESKFTRKDKLDNHRNVKHSEYLLPGEKPFPCDECESKFTRKDKLDSHRNVKHNENYEKTGHECYICNKAHSSKWHLNRHMERLHSFEQIESSLE